MSKFEEYIKSEEIQNVIHATMERLRADGIDYIFESGNTYEWLRRDEHDYDDITFAQGATRFVIIFKDYDFVLKVSRDIDSDDDYYNRAEEYVYKKAEEKGLAQYLAQTVPALTYTTKHGVEIPIYAMQKCYISASTLYNDEVSMYMEIYKSRNEPCDRESVEQRLEYMSSEDLVWELFEHLYGSHAASSLTDFFDGIGTNDLHEGNWGYLNGALVITDYAGYDSEISMP